jgi:2-hydroxycyclohexanecarboxyl-CoA dehydrogenase
VDLKLKNHRVLITGAASGIGLATARLFAEEGASLVLWDVSKQSESRLLAEFKNAGVAGRGVCGGFGGLGPSGTSNPGHHSAMIRLCITCSLCCDWVGQVWISFHESRTADWKKTLDINIMGMVNVAHCLAPVLSAKQYGSFVFLASVAGQIGSQTDPPYSASKAANINFAQCMAKDLAKHNVRVNTVCPGMVQTPLNRSVWQAWFEQTPEPERLSYEDWTHKKIQSIVPLGRWQTSEDIAAMIVFLSSDRAKEVTGQTINVDGGFVMHW